MSQSQSGFTKQMARNMFYGGSVFFALLFAVIVFDTEQRIPERSNAQAITPRWWRARRSGKRATASAATRCWVRAPISRPSWATSTSAVVAISSRAG